MVCAVVAARRRIETRVPPPRLLASRAGTFLSHSDRAPAEVRVDAFGARAESRAARGGRVAAALSLPALRAVRRCHGELRRRGRRGRAALRFLRRVPSARSGAAQVEGRKTARAAARPEGAAQDPHQLPPRQGMAARTGRHALPAAGLGARRRRAGALVHLFDRLPGAVPSGGRPGISRFPPRSRRARRHLRGSWSETPAPPGGGSEKNGATRSRRRPENPLAHSGRGALPGRVLVGAQAANRVFAAARSALARELRRAVPRPGPAPGPAYSNAVPRAGGLHQRRAGRAARALAEIPRAPRRRARAAAGRAPHAAAPRSAARLVPRRLAAHRRAP